MATPPLITAAELEKATARILWRHDHVDDPRRSGLGTDPRDMLDHLTKNSVGVPRWVAADDTLDALVLTTWLWWEDRRRERTLLRRGLHLGLTHTELGRPLGITTRQGLRDRIDRLDALLSFDRPDEQLTRDARRAASAADPRQAWLDAHRDRAVDVIKKLLAQAARLDSTVSGSAADRATQGRAADEDDWLSELAADMDEHAITPATISVLGLALGPLRIAARDAELPGSHGLHLAIRTADALRADLARHAASTPVTGRS